MDDVDGVADDVNEAIANATMGGEEEEADAELNELVMIDEEYYYFNPILRTLGVLHSIIAFSMLIAYYCLKV